jgi:hypothetical protein
MSGKRWASISTALNKTRTTTPVEVVKEIWRDSGVSPLTLMACVAAGESQNCLAISHLVARLTRAVAMRVDSADTRRRADRWPMFGWRRQATWFSVCVCVCV